MDAEGRGGIRVLLADDHEAIRTGLRYVLAAAENIEVVGEAADGAAAVTNAAALRPDVVLMDLRMPGVDGIEATRRITAAGSAQVLVLTTFDLDEYVFGALRAGAAGFLLKSAEPGEIVAAVRRVAAGDGVISPEVTRRVLDAFAGQDRAGAGAGAGAEGGGAARSRVPDAAAGAQGDGALGGHPASLAVLTPRETEVLAALGRGLSNQQLAAELVITEATAKTHVSRILAKLGCASRLQAAIMAREAGLG